MGDSLYILFIYFSSVCKQKGGIRVVDVVVVDVVVDVDVVVSKGRGSGRDTVGGLRVKCSRRRANDRRLGR